MQEEEEDGEIEVTDDEGLQNQADEAAGERVCARDETGKENEKDG